MLKSDHPFFPLRKVKKIALGFSVDSFALVFQHGECLWLSICALGSEAQGVALDK